MLRNFRFWVATTILVLEAFGIAYGESPVAVIRLPKEIEESPEIVPGDPVELDGSSSIDAKVFRWKVEPPVLPNGRATFRQSEDRKRVTLFSREGTYRITLMVANDEDISDATRVVIVGKPKQIPTPIPTPRPDPQPQPDPRPDPQPPAPTPDVQTYGLIEVVKASVAKNVPASQRAFAHELAKAYRQGADALARGVWSVENCVQQQSALNRSLPGYSADTWSPVFKDIAVKLGEARDANKLKTTKQWTAAFAELSVAFFQSYVASVGE